MQKVNDHAIPPAYGLRLVYNNCRLCTDALEYDSQMVACVRSYTFCTVSVAAKWLRARSTLDD
eukprot:2182149-Rhodomonas_salina.1